MGNCIKVLCGVLIGVPVALIWMVFTLLYTISGVGPLLHYLFCCCEADLIDRDSLMQRHKDLRFLKNNKGQVLAVRYSGWAHPGGGAGGFQADSKKEEKQALRQADSLAVPVDDKSFSRHPIVICNGLGGTIAVSSPLFDALVKAGHRVLLHDRLGVGYSDKPADPSKHISPEQVVAELEFVIDSVLPKNCQVILIGPSMGHLAAQAYMANHADRVVGFLNIDGVPFPFSELLREEFLGYAKFYRVYGTLTAIGVLRPYIHIFVNKGAELFEDTEFSVNEVIAQMNQRRFFDNLAAEFHTQIELCDYNVKQWGRVNPLALSPTLYKKLLAYPPHAVTNWSAVTKVQDSKDNEEVVTSLRALAEEKDAPAIARQFRLIPVRSMTGQHGEGMEKSFLTPEVCDLYDGEHRMLCLLARDGAHLKLPGRDHMHTMLWEIPKQIEALNEISKLASEWFPVVRT
jgi:pimeloyl-ACP methyl ester carboxylesterase